MSKIVIHPEKIPKTGIEEILKLCPFGAIELKGNMVDINAGCKMCKICTKKGPEGLFEFVEEKVPEIDKSLWKGILVYVEHAEGEIHQVTLELIGKAKEMAAKIKHPVYCVFIGAEITKTAESLLAYGVDEVFVYDNEALRHFRIEPYANAFYDLIQRVKPSICLVGGTTIGRSLAPRLAARLHCGLTADCTTLDVKPNTDLDQIRPAFGGNIMAHIYTPNHRPQFATVRYKIFSVPQVCEDPHGKITQCTLSADKLASKITVLGVRPKEKAVTIEDAPIVVAAGRGIKRDVDLQIPKQLADILGGMLASTRPLIECGWVDPRRQIGLSGRTVKPKLIITCGISGSVQFAAGMKTSDRIIAINTDKNASIMNIAHYGVVGDLYAILPKLITKIQAHQKEMCH